MHIKVVNFRGIASAEFDIDGFTIVGGKNKSGKTSLRQAIGSTLNEYNLTDKNKAYLIVREEETGGFVKISSGESSTSLEIPSLKKEIIGTDPPSASPISTGQARLMGFSTKDRNKFLSGYLKCLPTLEMFTEALVPIVSDKMCAKIWQQVEGISWDSAYERAKETGSRMKGEWQHITGEKFGEKKIYEWLPANWDIELADETQESLVIKFNETNDMVNALTVKVEVDQANIGELEKSIAIEDSVKKKRDESEFVKLGFEATMLQQEKIRQTSKAKLERNSLECPACHTSLIQEDNGTLAFDNVKPLTAVQINSLQKKIRDATDSYNLTASEKAEVGSDIADCDAQLRRIEWAKARLEELKTTVETEGSTEEEVTIATGAAVMAKKRLEAWKQMYDATEKVKQYKKNVEIQKVLSPEGLRKNILIESLSKINDKLHELTGKSLQEVLIETDLEISYGGRAYNLLCESEQYIVDTILQLYFSMGDGSSLVIIDRFDMLDSEGRNGLANAIIRSNLDALVLMTCNEPKGLPPIKQSYFLKESTI